MQRPELLALGLLAGCGRLDFDARPDARAFMGDSAGSRYADLVLASSPVAYYRLNESGGWTAVDASGNGNDGVYEMNGGTIQYVRPGAVPSDADTAVRFDADGNTGPAFSASVQELQPFVDWSADFTVEMFYLPHRPPPGGDNNVVFVCEDYLTNGFRVGWNEFESLHVWTHQSGGGGEVQSIPPLSMATFNHVAVVQKASQFTLYIDGAVSAVGPLTYIPAGPDAQCGFGAFHGMPGYSTDDEVALYPRALDAAEIASHAAAR